MPALTNEQITKIKLDVLKDVMKLTGNLRFYSTPKLVLEALAVKIKKLGRSYE